MRAARTAALCHEPAATVPRAPTTHTHDDRQRRCCGVAASATAPPAASMTAAASWVGATARSTWRGGVGADGTGQRPEPEYGRSPRPRTSTAPRRSAWATHTRLARSPMRRPRAPGFAWAERRTAGAELRAPGRRRRGCRRRRGGRVGPGCADPETVDDARRWPCAAATVLVGCRWSPTATPGTCPVPTVAMTLRRDVLSVIVVLPVGALDDRRRRSRRSRPARRWWRARRAAAGCRRSRG